jgi:autotransporter-associated beta strand protein
MHSCRPRPLTFSLARLSSAACNGCALFTASAAHAQVIWQGDSANLSPGDGVTWTDPLNWGGDVLPLAIDDLIFGNGQTLSSINLNGPQTANSFTFNAPFTLGLAATSDILTITSGNISVGSGVSSRINAIVAGANGLTLGGGGTLTLAGANTFTGPVAVNADSTLRIGADNNLGANANGVVLDTGILGIDGTFTSARVPHARRRWRDGRRFRGEQFHALIRLWRRMPIP